MAGVPSSECLSLHVLPRLRGILSCHRSSAICVLEYNYLLTGYGPTHSYLTAFSLINKSVDLSFLFTPYSLQNLKVSPQEIS